jgi:predicted RNA-binding protein YlxR (DUF448 family)
LTEALEQTEAVTGPRAGRTRMCAVTRAVLPESALIRFVAAPDGSLVADLKAKLPGRGIWVGAERGRVAEAVKRNVFARGLHQQVTAAADLPDQVAVRLRDVALGRLGLARKAGALLAGFAKVEAGIGAERLAAILLAADAAEDGKRKIAQALYRRFGDANPLPVLRLFASEELGLAMGRPNVIHAAVLQAPAGMSFVEAAIRLQRYEGAGDGQAQNGQPSPQDTMNE